jgi:hypothetical protein
LFEADAMLCKKERVLSFLHCQTYISKYLSQPHLDVVIDEMKEEKEHPHPHPSRRVVRDLPE